MKGACPLLTMFWCAWLSPSLHRAVGIQDALALGILQGVSVSHCALQYLRMSPPYRPPPDKEGQVLLGPMQ